MLEKASSLKSAPDDVTDPSEHFFFGYSPERINPGDKSRSIQDIVKVTSGSTSASAQLIDALYAQVITAGTHLAQSVEIAEAAEVIEKRMQRDVNIALVNELAILFDKLSIDTEAVLEAAATKWNFLPFRPGLVGGHCIGVDPYYLTYKAAQIGFHPNIILAGRRINEAMSHYVASRVTKELLVGKIEVLGSRVLFWGQLLKRIARTRETLSARCFKRADDTGGRSADL